MTESRAYEVLRVHTAIGRSSVTMRCPWCGRTVTAYTWSLVGSGKRCACGAKFSWHPKLVMHRRMPALSAGGLAFELQIQIAACSVAYQEHVPAEDSRYGPQTIQANGA